MKKKRSFLNLKKFTIASIRTPYTILGAADRQTSNCHRDLTDPTSSIDEPLSGARGCAVGNGNGKN